MLGLKGLGGALPWGLMWRLDEEFPKSQILSLGLEESQSAVPSCPCPPWGELTGSP